MKRSLCLLLSIWMQLVRCELTSVTDLGWPYDLGSPHWPNTKPFIFTRKLAEQNPDGSWYAMNEFCTGEHSGTHLDAPYHFSKTGWKVGDIPLTNLIRPGVCIDMSDAVKDKGANTLLLPIHIKNWEMKNLLIPRGSIVIINFNWSSHYGTDTYYNSRNETMAFPGISKEAAELLAQRGVFGVGVDTASVDAGSSTNFAAHTVFAANNIFGMENLKIPSNFPDNGYKLIALPMNIKQGTGAPLRLIAVPMVEQLPLSLGQHEDDRSSSSVTTLCAFLLFAMYAFNTIAVFV